MTLRLITAFFALLIVVPILFFGGVPGAQLLCVAAAGLGLWEYGGMRVPPSSGSTRIFMAVLAALPILAAGYRPPPPQPGGPLPPDYLILAMGTVFLAVPILFVFKPKQIDTVPARMTFTWFGVVYLGFTLAFCILLRGMENGLLWICFGLAVVWLGDTGAYVGGRAIGKHKLAPEISPKKTWEGLFCGLATSVVTGFLARGVFDYFHLWTGRRMSALDVLLVALLAGLMGVIGDLAESLLKRAAGVKDSGRMFPGHGGMLDRIDALLFAIPSVYFYAKFLFGRLA